jgi:hypothetical protein
MLAVAQVDRRAEFELEIARADKKYKVRANELALLLGRLAISGWRSINSGTN